MRILLLAGLLSLVTAAFSSGADFEGIIEMKTTVGGPEGSPQGGGTQAIAISKAGTRMQMDMKVAQAGMKMDFLMRNDRPKVMYQINDGAKTYTEIDLAKLADMASRLPQDDKDYVVEKLGEETILGYKTQHVRVTNKGLRGEVIEMWTSKDFIDSDTLAKLQSQQGGGVAGGTGLVKALKDAQADGLPLRSVISPGGGTKIRMDVTKVEKKPLPPSMFEIPTGYTKQEGGIMGMAGAVPNVKIEDAKKMIEEGMKKMSPEQREMMEKMLKRTKGEGN